MEGGEEEADSLPCGPERSRRSDEIAEWGCGSTPPRGGVGFYGGGHTWVKSAELNDSLCLRSSEETITDVALASGSFRRNKAGDVLIAMYGATIGKVAILGEDAVTNQAVCGCTPSLDVYNRFLYWFLISQRWTFQSASEGGAQPNISKVKLVRFPFPKPPLLEQRRIVAKCDRLEAAQAERERRRDLVSFGVLRRLQEPNALTTSAQDARFFLDRMPALINTDQHFDELRRTITSLAIRGDLVVQDPSDEPASLLLARIAAQKGHKKTANRTALAEQASTHGKQGWATARLEDVVLEFQTGPFGSSLRQSDYREGGTPVINPASIRDGRIIPFEKMAVDQTTLERLSSFKLRAGDVLLARRGEISAERRLARRCKT